MRTSQKALPKLMLLGTKDGDLLRFKYLFTTKLISLTVLSGNLGSIVALVFDGSAPFAVCGTLRVSATTIIRNERKTAKRRR